MKQFLLWACLLTGTTQVFAEPNDRLALSIDGVKWAQQLQEHFKSRFMNDIELHQNRPARGDLPLGDHIQKLFYNLVDEAPGEKVFFVNLKDFSATYAFRIGFPQIIYSSPFAFELGLVLADEKLFAATRWFDGITELDVSDIKKRLGDYLPPSVKTESSPEENKFYPMSAAPQTGGALGQMRLQTQLIYTHDKEDLLILLGNYRERFKRIANRDTAFSPEAYDKEMDQGGHPLAEHCGCATFAIQRLQGGEAMLSQYIADDGEEIWHMWNRVPVANSVELLDVDLTKGQFGLSENNFDPPGESFIKNGKLFKRNYLGTYQWESATVNPLRPQIIQFWTAFLTGGQFISPGSCEQIIGN